MSDTHVWTRRNTMRLRKAYDQAVANEQNTFQFDGHPMLTGYANYLLQHLEATLPPVRSRPVTAKLQRSRKRA